jgi:U3 small nucleolar RNA-associated protein 11
LKALREKATLRNEDEFSYKMLSSRTDSAGRLVKDRGNKVLSQDVVRLLKTQDSAYVRSRMQVEKRRLAKLGDSWTLGADGSVRTVKDNDDEARTKRHTVFVESIEEQTSFKPEGRLRKVGGEDSMDTTEDARTKQPERISEKERKKTSANLRQLIELSKRRQQELMLADQELSLQRAKMGKSNTVGGTNRAGVSWKPKERKR